MQTNRSLVVQQEKAEAEDRITLKSLRAYANALDCDLVYAFVPRADTLQELVDARARAAAKANVLGVEHTMALENQAGGNLEQAIDAEAQRLTQKAQTDMTIFTTGDGNTPLSPDEQADLIPNLATKEELNELERANILVAYDWALSSTKSSPARSSD